MCEARDGSCSNRVDHDREDRYRTGRSVECGREVIADDGDQVRIAVHDLASEIGKSIGVPLGRIPLNDQIAAFRVAGSMQLNEEQAIERSTLFRQLVIGNGRMDERDLVLLPRLLALAPIAL